MTSREKKKSGQNWDFVSGHGTKAQRMEKKTYPTVSRGVVGRDAEAVETRAAEHQLRKDEDESEFGLVDAFVPAREQLDARV